MNQDIQENLSVESESFTKRKPPLNSGSHRLINPHGGNEPLRLINTVIESEPRHQRNPNAQSEPFLI